MSVKNRIRSLLKAAQKTQAQLAEAVGVTPAAVSRYCDGKAAPTRKTARRIARFLGVQPEDLGLRERRRTGPKPLEGRIDRAAVEQALHRRGMSAAELGRKVGVSRQSISAYLAGQTMPRAVTLRRMAIVLGVKLARLVTLGVPRRARPARSHTRGGV